MLYVWEKQFFSRELLNTSLLYFEKKKRSNEIMFEKWFLLERTRIDNE